MTNNKSDCKSDELSAIECHGECLGECHGELAELLAGLLAETSKAMC